MPFGFRRSRSAKFGPPKSFSNTGNNDEQKHLHLCLFSCMSKKSLAEAEQSCPTPAQQTQQTQKSQAEAAPSRPERPTPTPLTHLTPSESADSFGILGSPCDPATPTPIRKRKEVELREAVEQLVSLTVPQNTGRRSSLKTPLVEDGIPVGLEIAHENRILPRPSDAAPPPNSPAAFEQFNFYAASESEPESPLKHTYFPRKPSKPAMRKNSAVSTTN